jgi:hypothetical protein
MSPTPLLADPVAPSGPGGPPSVAGLSAPELESELLGLAGHLAAAQCRFLVLLAEFDRRGGWGGPGLRSCAHWLSWRIGMSLRTAVEHVRVAHAMTELPRIATAFAGGRISYSKVRAITRIADAGSEEMLLNLALNGTASHVERVVRAARRQRADPAGPATRRSVTWHWAEDGALVLRGRFAPADGAALVAEIEARTGPVGRAVSRPVPAPPPDWQQRAEEESPGAATDRVAARRADALLGLVVDGAAGTAPAVPDSRTQVVVQVDVTTGAAAIRGGPEIPAATAERLACDATAQVLLADTSGNRLYLGRRRRHASRAQVDAITVRDGGRCQFPGCTHTTHLHAHHVRHWIRGGRTDTDNLVLVCSFHHALIHDRGYRITRDDGGWRVERPDGVPVPVAGAPLTGNVERLIEITARAAQHLTPAGIPPTGLTPRWAGEPLDPTPILQRLLPRNAPAAA